MKTKIFSPFLMLIFVLLTLTSFGQTLDVIVTDNCPNADKPPHYIFLQVEIPGCNIIATPTTGVLQTSNPQTITLPLGSCTPSCPIPIKIAVIEYDQYYNIMCDNVITGYRWNLTSDDILVSYP